MEGFYITVKKGLLNAKHYKAMAGERTGTIWLFLWLLDKMTDNKEGKILGGKPIKYEEIQADLGIPRCAYNRYLDRLRKNSYITTKRTPYGLIISINKAFKIFNQRYSSNATSDDRDVSVMQHLNVRNATSGLSRTATSNKTRQLDNTVDNNLKVIEQSSKHSFGNEDINYLFNLLKEANNDLLDGSVKDNRKYCQLLLNKLKYKEDKMKARNGVEVIIKTAKVSDFHSKNATSFEYLWKHASKIIQEYKNKGQKNKVHIINYE